MEGISNGVSVLKSSGSLGSVKDGMWVWVGGVLALGLGEKSGVLGIKLLLLMNLPLESLSQRISLFLGGKKNG